MYCITCLLLTTRVLATRRTFATLSAAKHYASSIAASRHALIHPRNNPLLTPKPGHQVGNWEEGARG